MNTLVSVIIDNREPAWIKALSFGGAPTATTTLDTGDFLVATSDGALLGIERKTSDDLLGTLKEQRLFNQLTRLKDSTPWAYLLISGPFHPNNAGMVVTTRETGWRWEAIQGALLTIQELGIHIIYASDDTDVEGTIIRLGKRNRNGVPVLPARQPNILTPGEAMLCALPGIGIEKLDALLEHCGTPAWALFCLTAEDGEHVPGIGPGVRAQVRKAIGLDDALEFVILPKGTVINDGNDIPC